MKCFHDDTLHNYIIRKRRLSFKYFYLSLTQHDYDCDINKFLRLGLSEKNKARFIQVQCKRLALFRVILMVLSDTIFHDKNLDSNVIISPVHKYLLI